MKRAPDPWLLVAACAVAIFGLVAQPLAGSAASRPATRSSRPAPSTHKTVPVAPNRHGANALLARRPNLALPTSSTVLRESVRASASVVGGSWQLLGPKPATDEQYCCSSGTPPHTISTYGNASGRVTTVVTDPSNSNIVFAGTAGGGVWKSTDGGATWTALTDNQPSLAIGALAIDPTGQVIYAGTGEDNLGDSQRGLGLLKSTNAGATWSLVGQDVFNGRHIGSIAIDRRNTQHILVAGDLGLYVSNDAGTTWTHNTSYIGTLVPIPGTTASGALTQVIQDPVDGSKFWLSASDFCRTEAGDLLTGDGANSWTMVTPTSGPLSTTDATRIGLGLGPNGATSMAWLSAADCNGNLLDLQKSADGGASWTDVPTTTPGWTDYFNAVGSGLGQGDYDNVVAVDPTNPSVAVFGGITMLATTDGGAHFSDIGKPYTGGVIHPDFHAVAFTSANHFYVGNDGGMYSTADLGGTGSSGDWKNLNAGLATIEYYAGSAIDASHLIGGSQDNGSSGTFAGAPSQPAMQVYSGSDGGFTAIDPTSGSSTVYTEFPGGEIVRGSTTINPTDAASPYDSFNDAGPCRYSVTLADPACSDPVAFTAPFVMDQGNPQRLVATTNKVYLTTSGGGSGGPSAWNAISGDLTTGTTYISTGDFIQALEIGPRGDGSIVMTGSYAGAVYRSVNASDASATWTDIRGTSPTNLPPFPGFNSPNYVGAPWITGLALNPANPAEAWATIGGLGVSHVWHTTNAGAAGGTVWSAIDGSGPSGLGNVIVWSLLVDPANPNTIYVGTDSGVLVCQTCGGASPAPSWSAFGTGLPGAAVMDLSLSHDNGTLFAWTHGRGVWDAATLAAHAPLLVVSPRQMTFQAQSPTSPTSQRLTVANDGNAALTWTLTTQTDSGGAWLSALPAAGAINPDDESHVTVSVNPAGLNAGSYTGHINITSNGGSQSVTVTLQVLPPPATSTTLHFPTLMNKAYGNPGYTTTIYLQNVSGAALAAGAINITYFDQDGNVVGRGDTSPPLENGAVWTVPQSNGNGFVPGQAGSGVVFTSAAVVGFTNQEWPNSDGSSYTAIPHPNTAATIYAPTVLNNAFGGYTTGMGITNSGTASSTVTVTYHDQAGNAAGTRSRSLAPNAYWGLYQGETGTPLPQNFAGTAVLTTNPPEPLAVVVNEVNPAGQFLTYEGTGAGSTALYAPVIFHDGYGGYQTGMGIQNIGLGSATVTIAYAGQVGSSSTNQSYTESFTIPAGGYVGDYNGRTDSNPVANPLPDQFHGSATITSTQPLVEIVNEVQNGQVPATSYNTFASGASTVHLPLVENSVNGFNTGLAVENVGSGTASVTITYSDPSSGNQVGTSNASPLTLTPGQFAGIYQGPGGDGGVAQGTRATATLTASGTGAALAVIVNQVSPSSFMSYTSQVIQSSGSSGSVASVAYQVDPGHAGNQPNSNLSAPLAVKWSVDLGGRVSYPLIAGGLVYVTVAHPTTANNGSTMVALDEHTGKTVWGPVELGGGYSWSNAAYDAGVVFAVNSSGQMRAMNAATGAPEWVTQMPTQYVFTSPPTAANGYVYTGGAGSGGTVYAVNETTGTVTWMQNVMNGDSSSPAVSGSGAYVSYACNQAYGFNPVSGSPLWHYSGPCEGGGGATVALYRGRVYTRDFNGDLVLDAQTGKLVDTYGSATIPAFNGSMAYDLNGSTLGATSLSNDSTVWTFQGDGTLDSNPLIANGIVFIGGASGNLYALRPDTGQLLQTMALGFPVTAPGEGSSAQGVTGLAAGDNLLVVPATNQLIALGNTGSASAMRAAFGAAAKR